MRAPNSCRVIVVRVQVHDRRAPRWQLAAGTAIAILLATLATFQYRWLGEVSEAERARMRETLQTRAADFTQAFDRELTQIYVAFHSAPDLADADPARAIGAELARAQASATVPGLIRDVFLLEGQGPPGLLRRFDPEQGALEVAEWPQALAAWRGRLAHIAPTGTAVGILPIFMADAVDAAAPALIIPVPFVRRLDGSAGRFAVVPDPAGTPRAIIVWLDAEGLRHQLLEPLAAKFFGTGADSEYVVSIVPRDHPSEVVYASAKGADVDEHADVSTGMFDLRINDMSRLGIVGLDKVTGESKPVNDRVAVTIVRRSSSPGDAARVLMTGGPSQGAWIVRARYRDGSLETIVARSRRRNLAISAGVLGLLGAAFALVLAAAQRQRRLARQQMEFVASVSHELRTPLAVICSAGENLADGVVADSAQVKTYGSLIATEGRRLGDMVERVLLFAGIGSANRTVAHGEVDVAQVIADAVGAVDADARERGVAVAVHPGSPLPSITGDADAIRSAVQNIIGNAVKYTQSGGSVGVTTELIDGSAVRIRVEDRGIGIDAADVPHVFEPFFRGRRAVDAQVRGSGIGLSVVRHVVQSHGGEVHLGSRPGEGTVVTVVLPVAPAPVPSDRGAAVRLRSRRASAS